MKLNPGLEEILKKHFGGEMKNLKEQAIVFSTYQLGEDEKKSIMDKFPQIHGKELINVVDESLMGGFVLTYGSKMIDLSVHGALQSLQNKLYEE